MNVSNSAAILVAAYLVVFGQSWCHGLRERLGVQIDLLPALMVYTSLTAGLGTLVALAICGGLWFDALSANPPGASVLPLFVVGLALHQKRELILRDQAIAQVVLGGFASFAVPGLTLLMLLTYLPYKSALAPIQARWDLLPPVELGYGPAGIQGPLPLIGWGTLAQGLVMAAGGAVATPVFFYIFDRLKRALSYPPVSEPSFRPDREIKRGRNI